MANPDIFTEQLTRTFSLDSDMRQAARLLILLLSAFTAPAVAAEPPLFDGHIHYSAADWTVYSPERVIAILEKAGIRRALVSSTPDDGTLKLYDQDSKRVVPILRPYRTRDDMSTWWRDPTIIPYLEQRLARGIHKGIGEFHIHGKDIHTPVLKRITEMAVQRDLYLHAHSDDAAVAELFAIEPRSRIIWAHAGMSSGAQAVGALMDKHASLWADLSYRYGDVAPGGTLDPAWRALLVRHADRFMLGSDTWTTSRWEQVADLAEQARRFLRQLPPDVAEKIAYKNIERLFP
jgi:amidohydrolase family protein